MQRRSYLLLELFELFLETIEVLNVLPADSIVSAIDGIITSHGFLAILWSA